MWARLPALGRRLQKRGSEGFLNGADHHTRLLEEDTSSVCSTNGEGERHLRRTASASPGPPVRERAPRSQPGDAEASIV